MRTHYAIITILFASIVFAGCGGTDVISEMTAEQWFRQAMNKYQDEDYLEALQDFEVIRLQYPGSIVSDSARYFAGMAYYQREEYLLASYQFKQVRATRLENNLMGDAQYMAAMCYVELSPDVPLDQAYTVRAIDAVQTFIEMYPTHPKVKEAEGYLEGLFNKLAQKEYDTGVLYEKMEIPRSALVYFESVIDKYYSTPYADDALYHKIRILVKQKKQSEANKYITEFLDKYMESPLRDDVIALRDLFTENASK